MDKEIKVAFIDKNVKTTFEELKDGIIFWVYNPERVKDLIKRGLVAKDE